MSSSFRHLPVVLFALLVVGLGMIPTVVPYFTKPIDRDYTFNEGFSDDYTGYVSYINQGMYGRNTVRIMSAPASISQEPTTIHILYIFLGKIGGVLGLSPVITYHLFRVVIGIAYILSAYAFFLFLLSGTGRALVATMVMFLTTGINWYTHTNGHWSYYELAFTPYGTNVVLRAISRHHYDLGSILFLWISYAVLSRERLPWRKRVGVSLLAFLLGIIHSPSGIILLPVLGLYIFLSWLRGKLQRQDASFFALVLLGLLCGLGLSYLGTRSYPWNIVYHSLTPLSWNGVLTSMIAFGPTFFLGVIGLVWGSRQEKTCEFSLYLLIWMGTLFAFFYLFFSYLHIENVRFIQSSAYLSALVYGTVLLIDKVNRWSRRIWYGAMGVLIVASLSTYVYDYTRLWQASPMKTKTYTLLLFPSHHIINAYQYLSTHTQKESVVVANIEAANTMQIYTHNAVFGGSWQGWEQDEADEAQQVVDDLFFGRLDESTMRAYLARYQVQYAYVGYQERRSDVFERHPLLFQRLYSNPDVTIYKII